MDENTNSTQPSPAGQGGALVSDAMVMAALQAVTRETLAGVGDTDSKVIGVLTAYGVDGAVHIPAMVRAMLQAALAARQPVGQEPAMYQVRPRSFYDGEGWRQVTKREYDDRGPFPGYDETEWERRALYTAPDAQVTQSMVNRANHAFNMAHDSGKDQMREALIAASLSAQAVDLNLVREAARNWLPSDPQQQIRHDMLLSQLALIDSKAAGK